MTYAKPLMPLVFCLFAVQAQAAATDCQPLDQPAALALFERWNSSLQSRDPLRVAALYSDDAVLLPTVSSTPRLSAETRIDYFRKFLEHGPSGTLNSHVLQTACNVATLAGLYTFEFKDDKPPVAARYTFVYRFDGKDWLISHHHSSAQPNG